MLDPSAIRPLAALALLLGACRAGGAPEPSEAAQPDPCASAHAFLAARAGPSPSRAARAEAARAFLDICGLEEAKALTAELVRFETVSAKEDPADGPAFVAMAAHLAKWSEARGLAFEVFGDNDAWIVAAGRGEPEIAFVLHADVVPVDAKEGEHAENPRAADDLPPGWSHPPFEVTEVDGRLYGRGTEDDKGPIAAVLVMMHTLARFDLLSEGRVEAILGTGEEHDWDGMQAFVKSRPQAPHVISLDANYPVVVAESGFVAWTLRAPLAPTETEGCARIVDAEAGQFLTQVPGEGRLVLEGGPDLAARVKAAAAEEIAARGDDRFGYAVALEAGQVILQVKGDAVHSSVAPDGANALWLLSGVAGRLDPCAGGIRDALAAIHEHLDGDLWGERLGLAYDHPAMGDLLVVPTVLRVEEGQVVLRINMRRPAGASKAAFEASMDAALAKLRATAPGLAEDARYVGEPALADTEGPLVETLLAIYREATGDADAQPTSIRGGTYARLFDGAVSFGPSLPGRPYRGHAPDEYLEIEALELMLETTLQAVLRLTAEP